MEQARFNMIEQQIRPWGLIDPRVIDSLYVVKREGFVPAAYRALAFADVALPLGHGQYMLLPRHEAHILQALNVQLGDRVLEIGTGSAYLTALLAANAREVVSIERVPELALQAKKRLESQGIDQVTVIAGDGLGGWPQGQPYDAIVLSGAVPEVPKALLDQLRVGGRLLAFVGEAPLVQVVRMTCIEAGVFTTLRLFETMVPPLFVGNERYLTAEADARPLGVA